MAGIPGFVGFSLDEDVPSSFTKFSKRQNGCFKCDNAAPTCPNCAEDESCQFTSQSCNQCPSAYCAKDPTASKPAVSASSGGPNVGAIAGGVVGGLAAIAIITYLVWRFCIKNKRGQYEPEHWEADPEHTKERQENDFADQRSKRASTHTVHSIASTVLTRASNIIQIAYIPGVTNRATPTSPTLLVPPVPPIPIAHSESGSNSPYDEQHFFVPGDLRDSTYSGISAYTDRTSMARSSYAPRSSVASTIYGKNAVVSPLPAQKGNFLKPSIISVKSKAPGSSGSSTPPVPTIDYGKYDKPPPSPAFSIGATFFKNASASTATAVRPQVVRVGSGPKTVDVKSKASSSTAVEESDDSEPLGELLDLQKERESNASSKTDDTTVDQGPFADPPTKPGHQSKSSLSAVMADSAMLAAESKHKTPAERNSSPFGDENALRD
ncbi:hypothetical protein GGR52DRAFT_575761 [Hypoxylon sp. FL1284]|nr:hypothetical protein GGR52DRAFT_575761 [Hypoxylon sp. FL1284]